MGESQSLTGPMLPADRLGSRYRPYSWSCCFGGARSKATKTTKSSRCGREQYAREHRALWRRSTPSRAYHGTGILAGRSAAGDCRDVVKDGLKGSSRSSGLDSLPASLSAALGFAGCCSGVGRGSGWRDPRRERSVIEHDNQWLVALSKYHRSLALDCHLLAIHNCFEVPLVHANPPYRSTLDGGI